MKCMTGGSGTDLLHLLHQYLSARGSYSNYYAQRIKEELEGEYDYCCVQEQGLHSGLRQMCLGYLASQEWSDFVDRAGNGRLDIMMQTRPALLCCLDEIGYK